MIYSTPPPPLEQYLLDSGIVSQAQLDVAKKLQKRQKGPLLMILLELSFIDLDQLGGLMRLYGLLPAH